MRDSERGTVSGVFRAYSGSVEADGPSEAQAIEALDERVRRLSSPPPAEVRDFELSRQAAANDVARWKYPGLADTSGRYPRLTQRETLPGPASSTRR